MGIESGGDGRRCGGSHCLLSSGRQPWQGRGLRPVLKPAAKEVAEAGGARAKEEEGAVPVALAAQAGTGCGWQQTLVLDDCFGAELSSQRFLLLYI